jgi:RimJ/RimL family protein N-acetyltransferase
MIETERLLIMPLTYSQLKKRTENQDKFAEEENLKFVSAEMGAEEIDAIQNSFLPKLADSSKIFFFHTMWLIIEKRERVVVGGICFHGEPDNNGNVEIGYGTEPKFQNMGFMKETILGMLDWLKTDKRIKNVVAETERDNISSLKLLEKCGFLFVRNMEDSTNLLFSISNE